MNGTKFFSKPNVSNGYGEIKIYKKSSRLLTFATPFGRFCFKRLPCGINSASEIFQADISEIIEGLEIARDN